MKRFVLGAACAAAIYAALLVVLGFALRGWVTEKVRARLATALDATVTIEDSSLSLLFGNIELEDVHIVREHGGTADIHVAHIDADLAPFGLMLLDRDVDHAAVSGGRIELSARGIHGLYERRKHLQPIPIGELELTDTRITVMPTSLLPMAGRIDVRLDRVHAVDVTLRSALSWVHGMRELAATVDALGFTASVTYDGTMLGLGGGIFGSTPLAIEFAIPPPDPDGHELAEVVAIAKSLARALAGAVKDQVKDRIVDWMD